MGLTALLALLKKQAADFITLKIPSSLARFEPTNLGTNGKHSNHYIIEDNCRLP
jgi:hypothetical protein